MADDVLKSYLVSIGFKLDEQDYKKFKDAQKDTEKRTKELSKAFADFAKVGIGAATVLGGFVLKVSSNLENLHFQAQKSGTSARNLKAFGDAAAQIGIQAEDAIGLVQQLNNKIQDNPLGMGALLGNLGVNANQDRTQVLLDLVDKLAKISGPNVEATRVAYGAQFGLSGEDIRTLIRGREELHKYYEQRKLVYKDIDQQSQAAHKAKEEFRDLEARFEALTNAAAVEFLPVAKEIVSFLEVFVKDLIEADKATNGWSTRLLAVGTALASVIGSMKILGALTGAKMLGGGSTAAGTGGFGLSTAIPGVLGGLVAKEALDTWAYNLQTGAETGNAENVAVSKQNQLISDLYTKETGRKPSDNYFTFNEWKKNRLKGKRGFASFPEFSEGFLARHPAFDVREKGNIRDTIKKYADKYGIDPALLDAQAYQESRYNPNALSPKGAIGVMQLMPFNAKGIDPYNPDQNIERGASMMAGLLKKYHGDTSLALAAFNAGESRVDRAGGIPRIAETQDYVGSIQRRMFTEAARNGVSVKLDQKTDVNVYGSGDPVNTADLVAKQQTKINSGLARDFAGAVQ
jgi:soluble lytic murein transglycosylase-like protein